MKIIKLFILILCVSSCAPIYVKYDYEKTTNFSDYKTYNFFSNIDSGLNELDEERLISALETKLNIMGLQKTEHASFLIDIKSEAFDENSRSRLGVGVGGGNNGFGGGVSVGIPIGQPNVNRRITVEFVDDSKTGLFWQAISESAFKHNEKPEKREVRFQAIVEKMMEGYPPKSK
ncbi:DUF4136 domain-containing protein [Lacinutrix jangbogonensis]|uniref:DUF4136 domain-containing protein n=1 Tax=Lacinutrix jangbogonensis TaxID=1469557 RepID=UPI00053D1CAE|nr:DUF4136 domain-containing protein [Lacinutrix jangbogonensis]